jgi:hypothetical protein
MKYLFTICLAALFFSCEDTTQKSDNEKEAASGNIEIKGDSSEIKINGGGVSVTSDKDGDSVNIRINKKEGIKVESKDGNVEINTGAGGSINIKTNKN